MVWFCPISVNTEHCKFTTCRFESKRHVVNLQCSALTEMGPYHTYQRRNQKWRGGVSKRPKIEKKTLRKLLEQVALNYQGSCAVNLACFIKSTLPNHKMGPVIGFKMGPCRKSRIFDGPSIFWAPKNLGPLKKSSFSAGPI